MVWLVRILIFAILATTGVVPLPWGHSHQGMQAAELDRHREQFHFSDTLHEMPQGWHWHFHGSRQTHCRAVIHGNERLAEIGLQLVQRAVDLVTLVSTFDHSSDPGSWKLDTETRAATGPKIYLRYLVLRN